MVKSQENRDIVVIGGSAGSLDALQKIISSLPADFPASVFIVTHTPSSSPGYLGEILAACGHLPVQTPRKNQPIEPGVIYVAAPDFHLLIESNRVLLSRGPRENRHRPAIDPLFRSAARWHGDHVIGVILSGGLDDGSSGLLAVRMRGGIAVVQDPDEATQPDMPRNAIEHAGADYIVPSTEIAERLISLTLEPVAAGRHQKNEQQSKYQNATAREVAMDIANLENDANEQKNGKPSEFVCPECHGTLWELTEGNLLRFRCRVGHAYTASILNEEMAIQTEDALWAAMRALEEKAALLQRIGTRSPQQMAKQYLEEAEAHRKHARAIRDILAEMGNQAAREDQEKTIESERRRGPASLSHAPLHHRTESQHKHGQS